KHDAAIVYDSIGVGASSGSKFAEINEERENASDWGAEAIEYFKFNAGGAVFEPEREYQPGITNKDFFANIKAQAWWLVADRFRNTYNVINGKEKRESFTDDQLISIDSDCPLLDKLKFELSTPKRDFDKNGRVKVETKDDLKKRDIPSPNVADAFIMAFAPIEMPLVISDDFLENI
ncbi:TPA: PBSX family phage terminase large subunit, partial [Serratia marcescens]|nr:PBSX family phage terminase large subunit [Serratia marcescens]